MKQLQHLFLMLCICSFTGLVYAQEQAMPVKFADFYADRQGMHVKLEFQTIDELNNKQFEIERSADGEHFEQIGIIAGHNNSTEVNTYEFLDVSVFEQGVILKFYYRLKQVDMDGGFTYSRVVFAAAPPPPAPISSLVLAPVPANEYLDVTYTSMLNESVNVTLLDWSGKILRTAEGKNGASLRLESLYELASGSYLLQIRQADKLVVRQIFID